MMRNKRNDQIINTERDENAPYEPTYLEVRLYRALDVLGLRYQRQQPVGYFTVDAYLPAWAIAVEADGCIWHGCKSCGYANPYEDSRQRWRDHVLLAQHHIMAIHIAGHDMEDDDAALHAIADALAPHMQTVVYAWPRETKEDAQ